MFLCLNGAFVFMCYLLSLFVFFERWKSKKKKKNKQKEKYMVYVCRIHNDSKLNYSKNTNDIRFTQDTTLQNRIENKYKQENKNKRKSQHIHYWIDRLEINACITQQITLYILHSQIGHSIRPFTRKVKDFPFFYYLHLVCFVLFLFFLLNVCSIFNICFCLCTLNNFANERGFNPHLYINIYRQFISSILSQPILNADEKKYPT